jgi:hypothetical protein
MVKDIQQAAYDYIVRERSDYQLRHFVVGQHDTPQMRYRQILIEVKSLVTKIRLAELDVEKQRIKLNALAEEPLDLIEAEELRIGIALTLDAMEAAKRELSFLMSLAEEYPQYTQKEIEDNQKEYWEARLQRQATLEQMGMQQGVSSGNLESMLNAGLLHRNIEQ